VSNIQEGERGRTTNLFFGEHVAHAIRGSGGGSICTSGSTGGTSSGGARSAVRIGTWAPTATASRKGDELGQWAGIEVESDVGGGL
jgi:hypothetical protein